MAKSNTDPYVYFPKFVSAIVDTRYISITLLQMSKTSTIHCAESNNFHYLLHSNFSFFIVYNFTANLLNIPAMLFLFHLSRIHYFSHFNLTTRLWGIFSKSTKMINDTVFIIIYSLQMTDLFLLVSDWQGVSSVLQNYSKYPSRF